MTWQDDYQKFNTHFQTLGEHLQLKDLNPHQEQEMVDNLNAIVEWGWKSLQQFVAEQKDSNQSDENPKKTSGHGHEALIRLEELFKNNMPVSSAHDLEYLHQNEWEIRAVIYPAFEELNSFLQSQQRQQTTD